jgi:DNA helicase-2/ATP-dependent DNA helicase PcrA
VNLDQALDGLTESQRRAVFEPAEAVCVLAGAGSGKTRVLTLRVAAGSGTARLMPITPWSVRLPGRPPVT